jgi:hypothetical protein
MARLTQGLLIACLLIPMGAAADGTLRAKIGTLGYGIEYSQSVSDSFAIRMVANGADTDDRVTESGITYDFDFERRSAGVLVDWRPMSNSAFFTSAGLLYNGNKFEANIVSSGNVNIGGTIYNNPNLSGEITFNKISPYLGAGWNWMFAQNRLSLALEVGALYQGRPRVELRSTTVSQTDLEREESELEDDLGDYKFYPQVSIAIGYRF